MKYIAVTTFDGGHFMEGTLDEITTEVVQHGLDLGIYRFFEVNKEVEVVRRIVKRTILVVEKHK